MKTYNRVVDKTWNFSTADTKEFTHCYHTYPAMMIPQVARRLISEFSPKKSGALLFDPYMGSGTSLVEASLAGINAIGTDLNPLARTMTKVKTTHFSEERILAALNSIRSALLFYDDRKVLQRNFDRISNSSFWYREEDLLKLSYLQQLIDECAYGREFLSIALAEVVREASFTRKGEFKRFRMSAQRIQRFDVDVFGLFEAKVVRNIKGLHQYNAVKTNATAEIYDFNSVTGIPDKFVHSCSVDIVVTSPPYGDSRTTVAYGQFSRWANEWFGYREAKILDRLSMGGGGEV